MSSMNWLPIAFWLATFASAGVAIFLVSMVRTRAMLVFGMLFYVFVAFVLPIVISPQSLGVSDDRTEILSWYLLLVLFRILELEGLKIRRIFLDFWRETEANR